MDFRGLLRYFACCVSVFCATLYLIPLPTAKLTPVLGPPIRWAGALPMGAPIGAIGTWPPGGSMPTTHPPGPNVKLSGGIGNNPSLASSSLGASILSLTLGHGGCSVTENTSSRLRMYTGTPLN